MINLIIKYLIGKPIKNFKTLKKINVMKERIIILLNNLCMTYSILLFHLE